MGSSSSNINTQEDQKIKEVNQSNNDSIQKKPIKNEEEHKIKVKIPLISEGYWEKMYNIEESLSKIALDFILENKIDLNQQNYSIEYKYKNKPINIDSTPLKALIEEDTTSIQIEQVIKKIINDNIDIIGKPFLDPFQIYCFGIKTKTFKRIRYRKETLIKYKLNKLGNNYAYCNGNNHLFISGGLDHNAKEKKGLFWDIDLKEETTSFPIQMFPKNNHSMIYIENKVYIIGGDDANTLIYNMNEHSIDFWTNLHYRRFEPSLIKHGKYLYCFDMSRKYISSFDNIINFERIDIYADHAEWELIVPNIPQNIENIIFCQKFFGVVNNFEENIIFVGGIYDKINDNDNDNENFIHKENEIMNMQYNINTNTIERSSIPFEDIYFNEKCFLPVNENTYINLPYFNKRLPKIVYFYKDKNKVKINIYHSQLHKNHKSRINNAQITNFKSSFIGLNFDMPGLHSNNSNKKYNNIYLTNLNYLNNKDNNSTNNDNKIFYNPLLKKNEKFSKNQSAIKNVNVIEKINSISYSKIINDEEENKDNKHKGYNTKNKKDEINIRGVKIVKDTEILLQKKKKDKKDKKDIKDNEIIIETKRKKKLKDIKETNSNQKESENEKVENEEEEEEEEKSFLNKQKDLNNNKKLNTDRIPYKINRLIIPNNIPYIERKNSKQMIYINEPDSLITFHSSSRGSCTNMFNSYRLKKKIRKGHVFEPINISIKKLKGQIKIINKRNIDSSDNY